MQELKYIGYGRKICSDIKIKWNDTVKTSDKNTVIVTDSEKKLLGRKFAYAIIIQNGRFIKYVYTEPAVFVSKIMPNSLYNPLNPPVIIQELENFNIIRDDLLPGGTKQRGLFNFLKKKIKEGYTEFAYAGPAQGVAQAALGTAAKILGVPAHMFYSGKRAAVSYFAEEIGVQMHTVAGPLKECQELAIQWAAQDKKRCLLPFGLQDAGFTELLVAAIKQSFPPIPVKHVWVVAGSAVLVNCLYHIFPEAFFHIVQVGRAITMDMIDPTRTQVFVHPEKFSMPAQILPPYNSVDNYDAKVWFYAKKYGRPGDFIWNVA